MKRLAAIGLTLSLTACGSNTSSSLPTGPSPTITDTFSGTVNVGGVDLHSFTVQVSNVEIDITLTAAAPPSNVFMGVYIGTPSADGSSCTIVSSTAFAVAQAGTTPQLSGTITAGTYCIGVYDTGLPGNQTSAVTYAVTVLHA